MNNSEIVKVLEDIADLLDLKGENVFKSRAYQKAARSIEMLSEEVTKLVAEDRLSDIPGVGEAISKKLKELVTTGRLEYYEKLKAEFPPGISNLLQVPGIGPRTALLLSSELNISNVDDLEKAVREGKVAALPRMGEKTVQNILQQIESLRRKKSDLRMPLPAVLPVVDSLLTSLGKVPGLDNLTVAGSLRRSRDTIGDIDLVATSPNPPAAIEAFLSLPQAQEVLEKGPSKGSIRTAGNLQVDLRVVDICEFGSALVHATGSRQHNIDLRTRAERLGLSLSEYGITSRETGVTEKFKSEEEFYARQGLDYIPPEIREGQREIELAEKHQLPRLLEISDIQGDLHLHSDWSDGHATLEELVKEGLARGYKYLGITDHSGGLGIARGLTPARIEEQFQAIRELNRRYPQIRLLAGLEVDIRADGSLGVPDDILARLDLVLASIHSAMNQSLEQMTERVIQALANPHVDILAHPTARLLGERPPIALDLEKVLKAAREHGKCLEISAMPTRLDLKDSHIDLARRLGIKMSINTDAHRLEQMEYLRFGVGIARRGWCAREDILNAQPLETVLEFLHLPPDLPFL